MQDKISTFLCNTTIRLHASITCINSCTAVSENQEKYTCMHAYICSPTYIHKIANDHAEGAIKKPILKGLFTYTHTYSYVYAQLLDYLFTPIHLFTHIHTVNHTFFTNTHTLIHSYPQPYTFIHIYSNTY